jgi:hypothetical protein
MLFKQILMVGFAVGLLPQGAMAIDLACQEKLDKALMTPFTDQATREVETFSVDGKALSRLTTEYLPVGIKKFTSENKLVPDTDPIWEKTTPVEDKRKLKDSTTIMTKDQTFENGVALYAAHKETEDPAFLAYLEAVKGEPLLSTVCLQENAQSIVLLWMLISSTDQDPLWMCSTSAHSG